MAVIHQVAIRVHGHRLLSDLLADACAARAPWVKHSSQPHAAASAAGTDLVVLSDLLVVDHRMVRDLRAEGVAHLPVRVRDGTGLVGPLVIPGVTSCLGKRYGGQLLVTRQSARPQ